MSSGLEIGAPRPVDRAALRRQIAKLERAPEPPWLHTEAARRMAERLAWIRREPRQVLEWWPAVSASQAALKAAYPQSEIRGVERVEAGADRIHRPEPSTAPWWWPRRWQRVAADVLGDDSVPAGVADLVWSNMVLHLVPDPQQPMRAWRRALRSDGFLMFTTLGPGSFRLLTEVYAEAGWGVPLAPLVDMHDLGDMLVEADFAEPVMDQERLTLTYAEPAALWRELRGLGGNADPRRHPGLRTPRWRARLEAALAERAGPGGRIALDVELVYGHAFTVPPRPRVAAETQIGLDAMREMMRSQRRPAKPG